MWQHRATSKNSGDVMDLGRFRVEAVGARVQNDQWAGGSRVDNIPDIPVAADVDGSEQRSEGQVETPSLPESDIPAPAASDEKEQDLRALLNCTPEFGINLAPLLVGLCADPSIIEKDEPWDYEAILQQVTEDSIQESAQDPSKKGSSQLQGK